MRQRVLGALLAVVAATTVARADRLGDPSSVVRPPVAKRKPPPAKPVYGPLYGEVSPCERSKRWTSVVGCLTKGGAKMSVLHEFEGAKLVSIRYDTTRTNSTVYLYVERDKVWTRGNLYTSTSPTSEVLSFKKTDERPGYRLDLGMITPTSTSFDDVTTMKVVLSRKYTTVCGLEANDCRSIMTACDAFIGGKAYWSFRGSIVWEGRTMKVAGDTRYGGKLCTPPKGVVVAPVEVE